MALCKQDCLHDLHTRFKRKRNSVKMYNTHTRRALARARVWYT